MGNDSSDSDDASSQSTSDHQRKSLLEDSDSDHEEQLQINKKYAEDFQSRKQKEELKRVRFEVGRDLLFGSDSDASTSESEDEDAELLTDKLDVDIVKTINALRNKDPRIYDRKQRFFQEEPDGDEGVDEDESDDEQSKKREKRFKDILREQVLEKIEKEEQGESVTLPAEEEDDDEVDQKRGKASEARSASRLAYDDTQKELRKAFIDSTKDSDNDSSSDHEGLLKVRSKQSAEEEAAARRELLTELSKLEETTEATSDLVDHKGEVQNGEKFLLDFFKKRAWVEKEDDSDSDGDDERPSFAAKTNDGNDSDASLEDLDKTDDFEARYNFRFEEAAAGVQSGAKLSNISYAREGVNTLRRNDEKRKAKREARKERKAADRKAKEEQLKRLKNAKRQEMEEKLKRVKAIIGDVEGRGAAIDEAAIMKLLEGDFDPDKFEELMNATYNESFYEGEESEWKTDQDVRNSLQQDEDGELLVGQDDADGGLYDDGGDDDNDGDEQMDEGDQDDGDWADEEEEYQEEEPQESELEKKMKERMMEELYKLDYEDIVAGQPTRFKYRKVKPNRYGLSPEEILFAKDTTLKQYVSLKKMVPYREEPEHFVGRRKRRRFREMLKKDLEELTVEDKASQPPVEEDPEMPTDAAADSKNRKKSRRLKKGKKKAAEETKEVASKPPTKLSSTHSETEDEPEVKRQKKISQESSTDTGEAAEAQEADRCRKEAKKEKKRKKKRRKSKATAVEGVSKARLASYGL